MTTHCLGFSSAFAPSQSSFSGRCLVFFYSYKPQCTIILFLDTISLLNYTFALKDLLIPTYLSSNYMLMTSGHLDSQLLPLTAMHVCILVSHKQLSLSYPQLNSLSCPSYQFLLLFSFAKLYKRHFIAPSCSAQKNIVDVGSPSLLLHHSHMFNHQCCHFHVLNITY